MASSAAETIAIDIDVLNSQSRALAHAATELRSSVGSARSKLGETSLGVLNTFLAQSMNHWASRTARLVAESAKLADRMKDGVDGAQKIFSENEDAAIAGFAAMKEQL